MPVILKNGTQNSFRYSHYEDARHLEEEDHVISLIQ